MTLFNATTLHPGFESLGHYTPQRDADALVEICRMVSAERLTVAEIGTFAGTTAMIFARLCSAARVWCVDTWEGTPACPGDSINQVYDILTDCVFPRFCRNMGELLGNVVVPLRMTSEFASYLPQMKDLHVVFIDAEHSYEAVKRDIELWSPKVVKGGVICGHDYTEAFPGVVQAADESEKDGVINTVWWKRL